MHFTVDIEIPAEKSFPGKFYLRGILCINGPCQAIVARIGFAKTFFEAPYPVEDHDRAENFFLQNFTALRNGVKNGGLYKEPSGKTRIKTSRQ